MCVHKNDTRTADDLSCVASPVSPSPVGCYDWLSASNCCVWLERRGRISSSSSKLLHFEERGGGLAKRCADSRILQSVSITMKILDFPGRCQQNDVLARRQQGILDPWKDEQRKSGKTWSVHLERAVTIFVTEDTTGTDDVKRKRVTFKPTF